MNIVPVISGIPAKTITQLKIRVLSFDLEATNCQLQYQLITNENSLFSTGVYTLTDQEFIDWGTENIPYLEDLVLNYLDLQRVE